MGRAGGEKTHLYHLNGNQLQRSIVCRASSPRRCLDSRPDTLNELFLFRSYAPFAAEITNRLQMTGGRIIPVHEMRRGLGMLIGRRLSRQQPGDRQGEDWSLNERSCMVRHRGVLMHHTDHIRAQEVSLIVSVRQRHNDLNMTDRMESSGHRAENLFVKGPHFVIFLCFYVIREDTRVISCHFLLTISI